jgi:hypothetical protein
LSLITVEEGGHDHIILYHCAPGEGETDCKGGKTKERGEVIFAMYENIRSWQWRGERERDCRRVAQIRMRWERVSYW